MRREADPDRLLNGLLDRFERQVDRTRRITARPAQAFPDVGRRDALFAGLHAAADTGAVTIERDRDAPHLIARVILDDARKLYVHLARTPATARDASALSEIGALTPATEIGRELRDAFVQHWRAGGSYLGFASSDLGDASSLLRVADGAFADLGGAPVPLRTRSTRMLGDSKAIERNLGKLLAHLRNTGRLDPSLDREAAAAVLGLSKFPQPVLLAGPLTIDRIAVAGLPYVGLPPEAIGSLGLSAAVSSLLTVENLESFHRHVREARGPFDVVIYCGGFPAQGVVHAVRHLLGIAGLERFHHWGDIDAGGVRIGRFLEEALDREVVPHLMNEEIACAKGAQTSPMAALAAFPAASSFASLALFLASPGAHSLEQEMLDPVAVGQPILYQPAT